MHICVYVYVDIYVDIYPCIHIRCLVQQICRWRYTVGFPCQREHIYIPQKYEYVYIYKHIYIYIYMYMYEYVYIYIYVCIHIGWLVQTIPA